MNRPFGIIFDVDGVIADSEAINVRATSKAFADILKINEIRSDDFQNGIGRGAEAYVEAGAASHGRTLSPEQVRQLVTARQDNFLHILGRETLPAFPGVLELIGGALNGNEFALAIATSSTREKSQAVLKSARIPLHKMVYVCGDDVSRKKPDPELFQIACRRLSIDPKRCVVIEDAPNGIEAARAAGCRAIAVTNTCGRVDLRNADVIVDTLTEVTLDTVRQLLGVS
jgi:HAD superfamily hydrolase (TIGR01509 family)